MLGNVDMLYLGASVLLMVDLSYVSRFWTQVPYRTLCLRTILRRRRSMLIHPTTLALIHPTPPAQFEAWLSLQACTEDGLRPAAPEESRVTIVPTLNGTAEMASHVRQMWAEKTPEAARELLALPDVTVTNNKDKVTFLDKLGKMNDAVKEAVKAAAATGDDVTVVSDAALGN